MSKKSIHFTTAASPEGFVYVPMDEQLRLEVFALGHGTPMPQFGGLTYEQQLRADTQKLSDNITGARATVLKKKL